MAGLIMIMSAPSCRSSSISRMASRPLAGSIWWLRRSPNCGVDSAASRNGPENSDLDHVGAFLQVELDLAHGFAAVGGVHLVAAPVAELRRGFGGLAERPVEYRS